MYKALISDFDNTLVGPPTRRVPDDAKKEIQKLLDKGVHFSIATGRPFAGLIAETCEEIGLTSPQIVMGGAEIIDPVTKKVLWGEYMPEKELKELIKRFTDMNLFFGVEKEDAVYTPKGESFADYGKGVSYKKIEELDYHNVPKIEVSPLHPHLTREQAFSLEETLRNEYSDLTIIAIHVRGNYGMNITSAKASKHIGVLEYMKVLNLQPEEVVGIGDGYNDYPLLTACGFKIAMGDAPDELKEIADLVVPTQVENGILEAIRKCFPENKAVK